MAVLINSIEEDVMSLAPRLRKADEIELKKASGMGPLDALMASLHLSDPEFTRTVFIGDQSVGIFGVTPSAIMNTGFVWMVGSPELSLLKKDLIVQTRQELKRMTLKYPLLLNVCYSKNVKHLLWLDRIGAKFLRRIDNMGYNKDSTFYMFIYHDEPLDMKYILGKKEERKDNNG